MLNELSRRMARLERRELTEIPSHWSKEERGRYLWRLLRNKGVDPSRLFTAEYFPYRQCWLLTQEIEHGPQQRAIAPAPPGEASLLFYTQVSTELRRTALAAFAAAAARSPHFARFGCKYQLPPKPQETTAAELACLLGEPADQDGHIRFTSEGGWRIAPLEG
jgi:hypothetical protein